MRLKPCLTLIVVASSIAGCATSGDFCDVAQAMRPSREDVLTADTVTQMVKHNTYGEEHCGWKPSDGGTK